MFNRIELKFVYRIKLRIDQFILSNHTALFPDDNEIPRISDKTSVIMHHHDLAPITIFHLKCIFDFVQAAVPPHPCISDLVCFEFVIHNYYNTDIQIESIDIDLGRFEITLDLSLVKFNQD